MSATYKYQEQFSADLTTKWLKGERSEVRIIIRQLKNKAQAAFIAARVTLNLSAHGLAFASDFGSDALSDLAGDAVVDEDVELGLPLHIDEARRDNEVRGIHAFGGGSLAEVADGGDAIAGNANVSGNPRCAGAIDDVGA